MHVTCSDAPAGSIHVPASTQLLFTTLGQAAGIADRGESFEVLLRAVTRATSLAIFTAISSSGKVHHFHSTSVPLKALRLAPEQIEPGVIWFDNIYPPDRARVREYWYRSKKPYESIDYRLIGEAGDLLWVRHWNIHWLRLPDHDWAYHVIQPITEQKYLEWECLQIGEREAVRVGQELHDDACQVLFGIACLLHGLSLRARERDVLIADEIDELTAHASAAADRLRKLAHTLFRTRCHGGSLPDALRQVTTDAANVFRISVRLECAVPPPPHADEQILQLCRIAQEAISNAVRHGRAKQVTVSLAIAGGDAMRLSIEDDGVGLPADLPRPEGIGLSVMQYRAQLMNGAFALKPVSPHGVAVEIIYPLPCAQRQLL